MSITRRRALQLGGAAALLGFTGGLARAFGYVNAAPWIIGLGLSQIGEFSFVLARSGLAAGAISTPVYNLALSCTVLTMALSPLVSSLALPLSRRFRQPSATTADRKSTRLNFSH